ncbi:MAG: 30S ribosomal protein S1 [Nitrospirae bacterium CG_4_9_14_3_um_filter_53_35]|nr:MAG: 30S ribosomal protein S1 [Nitrospirae bacterium CG2_30_53_67]PIS37071.1 MAG: 30S ribosomal protein S1 [Nitrospirae bacterium CG08_land_8_20_14_0_20_52_24]PIW85415.1 MAG: 30S ribosomal protein S1 [Nitrospirae bacterium CG_4_8_14_3_um_filter_50_41]PIX84847.1 MAG: 30S ribosomal protein S1 [Nitrospirae bacterium CG_4_10_14_3_um_filter_53_41]PJA72954.1 MAG: 30S ribosomal protein S1 [Nitrospirae bacterium CG_4_9_14_3_um_filter_53_35]
MSDHQEEKNHSTIDNGVKEDLNPGVSTREEDEFTPDLMAKMYEETFKNAKEGSVIKGRVLKVTKDHVVVDIGFKSEGLVLSEEFMADGEFKIKVGDEVDVMIEQVEDSEGQIVLSKEKADRLRVWENISKAYEETRSVEGVVLSRIKGGLSVDIGIRAFLPGSQVDIHPVRNLEKFIGKKLQMKIIKMNQKRGNIVLSRRALLEEERKLLKVDTLKNLEEGKVIKGIVKNLTEYGAFIDLGGIDGLLHITDMSWGRVHHPSELFSLGDEVEVVVLKFDRENERVSLGYKQKSRDPWESGEKKYPVGSRVKGKVVSLTDYGAFVELEEGLEGLVHVSEMSWTQKIRNPSKVVSVGDIVESVVLNIDVKNKRISLGMKQAESNPWDIIVEKYPVGARINGAVRNLTDFGAFIGLEEGIDGLVHISDMSWTRRIKHPSEILKKGETIEAVVLHVDKEKERLSLGIKQLVPDPWTDVAEKFRIDSVVTGRVIKITDFGVFVELENGIEGLIHISEVDLDPHAKVENILSINTDIKAAVVKIDAEERKIGLSIKKYLEGLESAELKEYMESHEAMRTTMGDLMGGSSGTEPSSATETSEN